MGVRYDARGGAGGAAVQHIVTGRVIEQRPLPPPAVRIVIAAVIAAGATPMVQGGAGFGVAMGHALDVVKTAANVVVPGNTQDGCAIALERYVLGA